MDKILAGVHVVEMCVAAAGPSCGRMLVDMGAEDVMVEPLDGQSTRTTAPNSFHFKCGGKKSLPLNLKTEEGKEAFYKLIEWADVFVSNYRTRALVKLGLDYETLSKINPRLVYGTLSGFGDRGPQKDDAGFDATGWWAKSGLLADAAQPGSIVQVPYATGDFATGHTLCLGICAALFNRERTGKGQKVSTSLMASGIFYNYDMIIESQYGRKPASRKNPPRAMLNTYPCGDGEWVSINATHHWEKTWPYICNFIGRPELIEKYPRHEDTMWDKSAEVVAILDEAFSHKTRDEVYAALKACDTISVEKVNHSIDVITDEQALANEFVFPWTDPQGKTIMHPATPLHLGDESHAELPYGPKLGENTDEVLSMIGYTAEQIADLKAKKVTEDWNPDWGYAGPVKK